MKTVFAFQLPLSGSPPSSTLVTLTSGSTFNSLSRDHEVVLSRALRASLKVEPFNSLSRDHLT